MKCLPECGFHQLPDSGPVLMRHMRDCDIDGPLKNVENPVVVWRDGGFAVVREAEKDETVYDVGFKRVVYAAEAPTLDIDLVDGVNVEVVPELVIEDTPPVSPSK